MGCPYGTEIPIDDKPVIKVIPNLLGKWEQRSSADYSYKVTRTDDYNYKIVKAKVPSADKKEEASSGDRTVYFGFISDVAGDKFFNIYDSTANPKTYYLYKIDMSEGDNMLKMASVTPNITEKFNSSAELKKFIEKYKGLSFFFEKDQDSYIKTGK
jgi:hypothetical protein